MYFILEDLYCLLFVPLIYIKHLSPHAYCIPQLPDILIWLSILLGSHSLLSMFGRYVHIFHFLIFYAFSLIKVKFSNKFSGLATARVLPGL
jgi:hypothetical protein